LADVEQKTYGTRISHGDGAADVFSRAIEQMSWRNFLVRRKEASRGNGAKLRQGQLDDGRGLIF
jgi:hypothetical protein